MLETYERIATDLVAAHYQKSDREEPDFDGTTVRPLPSTIRLPAHRGVT